MTAVGMLLGLGASSAAAEEPLEDCPSGSQIPQLVVIQGQQLTPCDIPPL